MMDSPLALQKQNRSRAPGQQGSQLQRASTLLDWKVWKLLILELRAARRKRKARETDAKGGCPREIIFSIEAQRYFHVRVSDDEGCCARYLRPAPPSNQAPAFTRNSSRQMPRAYRWYRCSRVCTARAVLVTRPALGTVIPVPSCLRLRLRLRLRLAVHRPQGRELEP
jgi:hypothetical protein